MFAVGLAAVFARLAPLAVLATPIITPATTPTPATTALLLATLARFVAHLLLGPVSRRATRRRIVRSLGAIGIVVVAVANLGV